MSCSRIGRIACWRPTGRSPRSLRDRADPSGRRSAPRPRGHGVLRRRGGRGDAHGARAGPRTVRECCCSRRSRPTGALAGERTLTEAGPSRQRARALLESTPSGAPVARSARGRAGGRDPEHRGAAAARPASSSTPACWRGQLVGWVRSYARRDGVRWSTARTHASHTRLSDRSGGRGVGGASARPASVCRRRRCLRASGCGSWARPRR